ncbi:MAG TPA: hypothetical protein VFS43_06030 [Polyangiaceae bacterium]|nr:hypothetical protein [Polyangiaceae bacterium]
MTNASLLNKIVPFFLCATSFGALASGCGSSDAPARNEGSALQPTVAESEPGNGERPAVPTEAGREPGDRPRTGGSCEFGGFSWEAKPFALYPDEEACLGDQWVRFDAGLGLWVGLTTCSSDETRIYLAASPEGPFLAAADTAGHGQDHCELVNAGFTLGHEDDITSGGCTDCSTGPNLPLEGLPAYARAVLGEPFSFVEITPEWSHQVSRLRCGVQLGCAAPPPPPPPPDGSPVEAGPLRINDCGYAGASHVATAEPGQPELFVLSVYETRSDHGFGYHPTGEASVTDTRTTPHVLVLSSYEPTHWTINADAAGGLTQIILNGYHDQTVTAPPGVLVSEHSGFNDEGPEYFSACGYAWPNNDGGCDTPGLVSGVESFSGLSLSAFAGCYVATNFEVRDGDR